MLLENLLMKAPEPVTFVLTGKKKEHLFFGKSKPFKHKYTMEPMTLATIRRVSKVIVDVSRDAKIKEGDSVIFHANNLTVKHLAAIAEAVSITIEPWNRFKQKRIKRLVLKNTTPVELLYLLQKVIELMDIPNFIKSVVQVMGLNIMPQGGREATSEEVAELKSIIPNN